MRAKWTGCREGPLEEPQQEEELCAVVALKGKLCRSQKDDTHRVMYPYKGMGVQRGNGWQHTHA